MEQVAAVLALLAVIGYCCVCTIRKIRKRRQDAELPISHLLRDELQPGDEAGSRLTVPTARFFGCAGRKRRGPSRDAGCGYRCLTITFPLDQCASDEPAEPLGG